MISSHGGQPQILQIACRKCACATRDHHHPGREQRAQHRRTVSRPHEQRMAMPPGAGGADAGAGPECVRLWSRRSPNFRRIHHPTLVPKVVRRRRWASYDFGPSRVISDPTPATREQAKGFSTLAASWASDHQDHRMAPGPNVANATWGKH
ncbi:hypothetical protein MJ561_16845 [Klebsiella pneumoniae]|nr:hypothetical protein MJ561_16845 [Klebsiella pneumoniae]